MNKKSRKQVKTITAPKTEQGPFSIGRTYRYKTEGRSFRVARIYPANATRGAEMLVELDSGERVYVNPTSIDPSTIELV